MQRKIASIQAASLPDSHEKGWETKAPHNHHLLSFPCHSADASPAGEMAAPSEEAAMRCCFMSRQRNPTIPFFFFLAKQLKLACHIYRANPFIQPQQGFGTTPNGMSWWLSWHLCAKMTCLINNIGCCKKQTVWVLGDSPTSADWSSDRVVEQHGRRCHPGSLERPCSRVQ